jgi:hypothetical protein
MSIASQIEARKPIHTPEKGENLSGEFLDIPPCTIEDVDKALFNLFDKDLPLLYTHRNDTRRVPIVFATGERFAIIARKQPLRDRSKALILPVISIMRSGLTFGSEIGMGTAPDVRHVLKKQLAREDPAYQKIVNKIGLQNSDDLVSDSAFIDSENEIGVEPGRIATRRSGAGKINEDRLQKGNLLDPKLGNNVYEIYEMPAPSYFMATYEVTIWTQYMQEMNNLLSAIATENHFDGVDSFRIETDKGYYFVAYVDSSINLANNFDDFSEEERIVRSSLTIKVPGYFLGSAYKGSPNKIRRYVSAPQISFDTLFNQDPDTSAPGVASSNPGDYVLSDMMTEDDQNPGQFIGGVRPVISTGRVFDPIVAAKNASAATIGGYVPGQSAVPRPIVTTIKSPFQGDKAQSNLNVAKTSTTKQGETTYRQIS